MVNKDVHKFVNMPLFSKSKCFTRDIHLNIFFAKKTRSTMTPGKSVNAPSHYTD